MLLARLRKVVITLKQDGPDPSCGVGEVLDFVGQESTLEDVVFPVGEPLLEDLVTTKFVGPDGVSARGLVVEKG